LARESALAPRVVGKIAFRDVPPDEISFLLYYKKPLDNDGDQMMSGGYGVDWVRIALASTGMTGDGCKRNGLPLGQ
jgi:hypothetical protein